MSVLDAALEFSDAQAVTGNGTSSTQTVKSSNVADMRTGLKDAWGSSKAPEIGNAVINVRCNEAMVGASVVITPKLVTKADASISSGATVVATLPSFAATSAAGTKRAMKLPPGTACLRYLGVIYEISGGNATAGKFDAWLGADNEVLG